MTKQIAEAFNEQRKKIINATYNSDNFNNEVLQIIEDDKERFVKLFQQIYKDVIRHFGAKTYQDIQSRIKSAGATETKSFDFTTDAILSYITTTSAEKVVLITETTKTDIKNIIIDSVAQGASILTMTESLDKLYLDKIIPNRSRTIARTEVVSASNFGSLAGAEQTTPKLRKVWIPTFDDSTRDSHRAMANHPPIKLNEYFDVAGSRGRYPADFSLPASQSINCRCAIGYEYAEETPKRRMTNALAEAKHGRRRGIILDTVYERQNND